MTQGQMSALIKVLEAEVGVRETGGQNRGPRVEEFQAATYNGPGDSWCQSFLIWGLMRVLIFSPLPRSGRCETVRSWADGKGWTVGIDDLEPCSMGWVTNAENHAHHVFLVTNGPGEDGKFDTVEGNTNDRGDSNGDGVYDRRRGGPDDHNRYVFLPMRVVPT